MLTLSAHTDWPAAGGHTLINTYLAIGLLVALQLNSVIAPRIGFLDRA